MDVQKTDGTYRLPLKVHRSLLGFSQYVIQNKSGVFQSRLSLIENGLAQPTDKEAAGIAEALGVAPEEIAWPITRPLKRNSNPIHNDGEKNV
jgi:transcriptional regulator with XRE-family HTH domain